MRGQILHILRKDARQHWREIALYIVVLVAYAWHQISLPAESDFVFLAFSFISEWLSWMVPIASALLIVRAVHAESLVGDRQFWVTRPYEWKKLLAAKLIFVFAFVNVPLLILQIFLLLKAGYSPFSYVPGLLWLQLMWALMVVLPAVILATVTASIGQFVFAVLGLFIYFMSLVGLASSVPVLSVEGAYSVPVSIGSLILSGAALTAILWQFARRRTARSRILLASVAVVYPIIILIAPYKVLIAHHYPVARSGEPLPVQLAFDPAKPTSHKGGYLEKDKVHIQIPWLVSGIPEGSVVYLRGTMETIHAPGGLEWGSGWHGAYEDLLVNRPHTQTVITLDRDFFERVKSTPVKLSITLALESMRSSETVRIVTSAGQFRMPGDGRCSPRPAADNEVTCLFPPKFTLQLVSALSDELTCSPREGETPPPAGTVGYGWTSIFPVGINPVTTDPLWVSDWGKVEGHYYYLRRICPGTPLTIYTGWKDSLPFRTGLEINGILLSDYQLIDSPGGADGFGFVIP